MAFQVAVSGRLQAGSGAADAVREHRAYIRAAMEPAGGV